MKKMILALFIFMFSLLASCTTFQATKDIPQEAKNVIILFDTSAVQLVDGKFDGKINDKEWHLQVFDVGSLKVDYNKDGKFDFFYFIKNIEEGKADSVFIVYVASTNETYEGNSAVYIGSDINPIKILEDDSNENGIIVFIKSNDSTHREIAKAIDIIDFILW